MSASMAEVIQSEGRVIYVEGYGDMLCFRDADEVAEQLAANGYGKLEDARAQSLTDAADDFESNIGVAEFDDLAERNGSRWAHIADAWEYQGPFMDWLRNRAATERGRG